MVQEERRQDLKNMFHLLNGIPGALDVLLTEFEHQIKSRGTCRVCVCVCVCLFALVMSCHIIRTL